MLIENVIKNYKKNINEIIRIINTVDKEHYFSQTNNFPPDTICHPIWTLGHLIIAAQGICEEMGIPHWLDENWQKLYSLK